LERVIGVSGQSQIVYRRQDEQRSLARTGRQEAKAAKYVADLLNVGARRSIGRLSRSPWLE
jgi:hypothetical protein